VAELQAATADPVQERAAAGVASGSGGPLPHQDRIQASFGRHDVGHIESHVGGEAARAAADIGARAYATGNQVAFASQPDLHTAAHEAAHVVQQRGGVQLKDGVGRAGDAYEQHADAVADRVVAGQSAEALLDQMASSGTGGDRAASGPVQLESDSARSEKALLDLKARRERGENIPEREQAREELGALATTQGDIDKDAPKATGSEIANIHTRVLADIVKIEAARAIGYLNAVTALNAKGLDKAADYSAFATAMGGNLLWALSGILPAPPLAAIVSRGLMQFFKSAWVHNNAAWTAAVGSVGAMTAQFSGGSPSSSSTSDLKLQMIDHLTSINAAVCDAARHESYLLLAGAVARTPPQQEGDIVSYVADLEVGLRHALYGDIWSKQLNAGGDVDSAKVQRHARDQLLRQYAVANAALDDGQVVATRSMSGCVEVGDAIGLLGGQNALNLQPYELVENQMRTAAADLGCNIRLDGALAAKHLQEGKDVRAGVISFDPWTIFGGQPSRWMAPLHTKNVVECEPSIENEPYMTKGDVGSITSVTLRHADLTGAKIGATLVYSAQRLIFEAEAAAPGRRAQSEQAGSPFISTDVPDHFRIIYTVKP